MKVVFRGTPPSEREYRCTCYSCKSVFEFKMNEAKVKSDPREGSYLEVACPVCAFHVTKQINDYIKESKNSGHFSYLDR